MNNQIWNPDFCQTGPRCCSLVITQDYTLIVVLNYCRHHQSLKGLGLSDVQVFNAMLASVRRREIARWIIKSKLMELALMDKEHPGIPYTVDADGNFTLVSGTSGATRTQLRTLVTTALALLEAPVGTSTVTVA